MPIRTIAIPVAEVVEGGTKAGFYGDLRQSLDLARRAANKSVSLCMEADGGLMTGGKCPKLYTYPVVSAEFPGASIISSNLCRSVEAKYRCERWHVARGMKSVCTYRSFPWPLLSNKSASTLQVDAGGESLLVRVKLAGGWWTVRMAGGSSHSRQVSAISSAVRVGDSKIWIDRRHRAVIGFSVETEGVESKATGTLSVSTARDCLLIATKEQREVPFVISGYGVQQWIAERDRRYQRLRQDRKVGRRESINGKLRSVGDQYARRLASFMHETAAHVVKHAIRRKCGTLVFDGTIKSFAKLPWHDLKAKIKYKCEDCGIQFVDATQQVSEPDVDKPHVYFKYSPSTGRVKIGKTARTDGGRHGAETDSPEELIILAVDNQPKNKLTQREKHFHAYFADHRLKGEWFGGEPVIHWLREAGWFGNAGNISQIAQVLPVQELAPETASSRRECERASGNDPAECSQSRITGEDIPELIGTGLAVNELTVSY